MDPVLTSEGHDQLGELLEQASGLRDLLAKEAVSKPPPPPPPKRKPKPKFWPSLLPRHNQPLQQPENPQPGNGKHGHHCAVSRMKRQRCSNWYFLIVLEYNFPILVLVPVYSKGQYSTSRPTSCAVLHFFN